MRYYRGSYKILVSLNILAPSKFPVCQYSIFMSIDGAVSGSDARIRAGEDDLHYYLQNILTMNRLEGNKIAVE